MTFAHKLDPRKKVRLSDFDAGEHGGMNKEEALTAFQALATELRDLQELLYAAAQHSVLMILQGRDTSGKDGAIKSVLAHVDPQGCQIAAFKVPSEEELSHDFLWRVHRQTPSRGRLGIFNRSHYEDVLVARVHGLVTEEVWKQRYRQINDFEQLLHENGTILLKCYLHISSEEQEKRLLAREQDPVKAWKLSLGDWQERKRWDDYTEAYEDALEACGTKYAPWYIVPADKKWFRNLVLAELLVKALRPYRDEWARALAERGANAIAEIEAYRREKRRS